MFDKRKLFPWRKFPESYFVGYAPDPLITPESIPTEPIEEVLAEIPEEQEIPAQEEVSVPAEEEEVPAEKEVPAEEEEPSAEEEETPQEIPAEEEGIFIEEEIPAEEEPLPAEEEQVRHDPGVFTFTTSQNEMFRHLTNANKDKKKGILGFILAGVSLLGCLFGLVTIPLFVLAAICMVLYGKKMMDSAKAEESLVSDVKRDYLSIENGVLHCEQGVSTQYEEIHIPIDKIKSATPIGNRSFRSLVIQFDPKDAEMLVNGVQVEESMFEIRGGMYEQEDWFQFSSELNKRLAGPVRYQKDVWEQKRKGYKTFLILGIVFDALGIAAIVGLVLASQYLAGSGI